MPETKRLVVKQILLLFIHGCWPFQPRSFCLLMRMPTLCWQGGTDQEPFMHFPEIVTEQSLKPGNEDRAKEDQNTFWCFVFNRHKAAEFYMVFLGLATFSSSLCLMLARQASHSCHLVFRKGQGTGGAGTSQAPRLHRKSGGDTHFKELLWCFQLPARSLSPKRGPR